MSLVSITEIFNFFVSHFWVVPKFSLSLFQLLWVCSSEFLIVGVRSGKLHFIDTKLRKILMSYQVPTHCTETDDRVFFGSACHPVSEGYTTLWFLTSSGLLLGLGNLNIDLLQESIKIGSAEGLKKVKTDLTLEQVSLKVPSRISSCGFALGVHKSDVWLWFATINGDLLQYSPSDCGVSVGSCTEDLCSTFDEGHFTKIIPICSGNILLGLSSTGRLCTVCPFTHHVIFYDDLSPVVDVVLLPWSDNGTSNDYKVQLLMLQKGKAKDSWELRIVSIPDLECEYEVDVMCNSQIMPLGEGSEALVFLEPDFEKDFGIKMKSIIDGQPEARLKKLICKLKFDDALTFATHFNLDVELVHKGKARHLANLMNPFRSTTNMTTSIVESSGEEIMTDLLESLDKISDLEFIAVICTDSTFSNVDTISNLLTYAKKRLSDGSKDIEGDNLQNLSQRVASDLYKLKTLTILYPKEEISIEQWISFSTTDLLKLFKQCLANGELSMSNGIWQRHQHEFQVLIDCQCVESILSLVPLNLSSSELLHWIPHNLSDYLRLCPEANDVIAKWTLQRIKRLEFTEKGNWPANGMKVADTVLSVLESTVMGCSDTGDIELQMTVQMLQWKAHMSPSSSLYELRLTIIALRDLEILASKYKIKINMEDYMQSDVSSVIYSLLDWLVCGIDVAPLLDGFIVPVLLKQRPVSVTLDSILQEYVEATLSSDANEWCGWEEAQWEDKLYAVISAIRNEKTKVTCILSCVEVASVPWSKRTDEMCTLGLDLVGSLGGAERESLKEQKRLVALKIILRKYSVNVRNFTDPKLGFFLLRKLAMSSFDDVMTDMLKVVSTFNELEKSMAYSLRCFYLLKTGSVSAVQSLLDETPQTELTKSLSSLASLGEEFVTLNKIPNSLKSQRANFMRGVLSIEHYFVSASSSELTGFKKVIESIRTLVSLQEKFSITIGLRTLQKPEDCRKIVLDFIHNWYDNELNDYMQSVNPQTDWVKEVKMSNDDDKKKLPLKDKENICPGGKSSNKKERVHNQEDTMKQKHSEKDLNWLYEVARLLSQDQLFVLRHLAALAIEKKDAGVGLFFIR